MRCMSLAKLRFSCTLDPNQPKTNASRHVCIAFDICEGFISGPIVSTVLPTRHWASGALVRRDGGSDRSSLLAGVGPWRSSSFADD